MGKEEIVLRGLLMIGMAMTMLGTIIAFVLKSVAKVGDDVIIGIPICLVIFGLFMYSALLSLIDYYKVGKRGDE